MNVEITKDEAESIRELFFNLAKKAKRQKKDDLAKSLYETCKKFGWWNEK